MNEQIRKLMEGLFDVTVDSRGREECTADYINVQKFADLIIMECVEIVETQRVPVGNSPAGETAARLTMLALRDTRDEIKEHFGVENERTQPVVDRQHHYQRKKYGERA